MQTFIDFEEIFFIFCLYSFKIVFSSNFWPNYNAFFYICREFNQHYESFSLIFLRPQSNKLRIYFILFFYFYGFEITVWEFFSLFFILNTKKFFLFEFSYFLSCESVFWIFLSFYSLNAKNLKLTVFLLFLFSPPPLF